MLPSSINRHSGRFRPVWASRGVGMAIFELGVFSTVQSRTGKRNHLFEPASRRFLVLALRARPGTNIFNVFAAPPPTWGRIKLVSRPPGLRPPPRLRSSRGARLGPGILVPGFLIRVLGCMLFRFFSSKGQVLQNFVRLCGARRRTR